MFLAKEIRELKLTSIKGIDNLASKDRCRKLQEEKMCYYSFLYRPYKPVLFSKKV